MDLNFDFFKVSNEKEARAGRVLISEPFLSDSYFKRSVVYLTEHHPKGSIGFVLNKSLELKLEDVIDGVLGKDFAVSVGGPVATETIHYLHTVGDLIPDSVHVKDGIFWGGDFEALKELIATDAVSKEQVRFFLGYSGWTELQLDGELSMNAWLVGDIPPNLVMKGGASEFWTEVLSDFNPKYKAWANFPEDPGLN